MASTEPSLEDRIKSITAVVSAIGGLLAALPGLSKNCREVVEAVPWLKLSPWAWLVIALALLIFGVVLSLDKIIRSLDQIKQPFKKLAERSRLRRPAALWLRADRPEHLIGRERDVERLTKLCKDFRLIFLVGESGAGKSALLQSGLVPSWAESQSSDFFPIYLDVWGEDWEKGPRQSLCDCVWKALSANDRKILAACELRLLSAVTKVSDIPPTGNSQIIVAVVDQVLHFRVFNSDGELVADTNEKALTEQTPQIEGLRKLTESLWPPHELSKSEKDQVITAVTSIVGRTIHTVKEAPRPEDLVAFLGALHKSLKRTPVILLDQFDDYQSRHRSVFLPPNRNTWLSTKNLVKKNAFWRDLQTLLGDGAIRCVIATRSDAADGLECVRVGSPRTYRLERLEKNHVETLLTRLTESVDPADPVVAAPEAGWERLKERLARDLDQDGAILPVRMRTAFRGLAALPALTPRAYDREGALQGIEAAHIEQQITNAALNSGLSKPQVRSLLVALVDRERLKTFSRADGRAGEGCHRQRAGGR